MVCRQGEVAGVRMREQLVVVIAIAVATIAVAANVFAQTRAANQRIEMEREGVNAAWSYPVMDATASMRRVAEAEGSAVQSTGGGEDTGTRSGESAEPGASTEPAASSAAPCSDVEPCTIEEVLDHNFRNHGQMVRAYVHALGFEEGLDGPRGSFVRQIAKPDKENDDLPSSAQAVENQGDKDTPPGQKDKDTPPGQKDKDIPPGQKDKGDD